MKTFIIKIKDRRERILKDPYNSIEKLAEYLLMRKMHDCDLGNFSYKSINSRVDFIKIYMEVYSEDDPYIDINDTISTSFS